MKKFLLVLILSCCFVLAIKPEIVFSQNWQFYDNSQYQYNQPYQSGINNTQTRANQENILIILDSSASMEDKVGGERKIDIAKRTINNVLSKLPPSKRVGLRVYGHKGGLFNFNACRASELMVPIGTNNTQRILKVVNSMKPSGMTPITYSLQEAISCDFAGLNGQNRIILVSDGAETCDGSPCDFAIDLVKRGSKVKIDAVGFALDEADAVSQLKCVALSTKAEFYSANNAQELEQSLIKSLNISTDVHGMIIK